MLCHFTPSVVLVGDGQGAQSPWGEGWGGVGADPSFTVTCYVSCELSEVVLRPCPGWGGRVGVGCVSQAELLLLTPFLWVQSWAQANPELCVPPPVSLPQDHLLLVARSG